MTDLESLVLSELRRFPFCTFDTLCEVVRCTRDDLRAALSSLRERGLAFQDWRYDALEVWYAPDYVTRVGGSQVRVALFVLFVFLVLGDLNLRSTEPFANLWRG